MQDLKEYLGAGLELNAVIAGDVMRPPPPRLWPGQKLLDALPVLLASELRNIPVVNNFEEDRAHRLDARGPRGWRCCRKPFRPARP